MKKVTVAPAIALCLLISTHVSAAPREKDGARDREQRNRSSISHILKKIFGVGTTEDFIPTPPIPAAKP